MSTQSTIHITFELPPKSLPKFYNALKTLQQHVIAEPECVYFNCFELPKQPGKVRIVKIWNQDKKWRKEAQARKSYYEPFMRVVNALETKPKKVEALQPIEGFYFGR
ncbi:hypothetical protein E2P81_ATG04657 [Venturia nashicola]|uniref:ABM domain-containing protein n=1 Tax=Venturia nashicola TaxID=86259 RepID=A0A4Z1P0V9_9PEZI|nr:hypothetical protein E6O75_ATG04765 [Venturia nashicola]TLD34492.1 hypothetical protein E2P81_ATG04657 [Venturia nashicola]